MEGTEDQAGVRVSVEAGNQEMGRSEVQWGSPRRGFRIWDRLMGGFSQWRHLGVPWIPGVLSCGLKRHGQVEPLYGAGFS